jgi:hypothetical protein
VRSESLTSNAPAPGDATADRNAVTLHAHLTALPGLLAEAELAEAHVEARDRRTGALVAYSFATIHRALALHVAEAVRIGLARLGLEANPEESNRDGPGLLDGPTSAGSSTSPDDRPGHYL